MVNSIFIFVTFLLSLPALFLPLNRGWLRAQGWLVVFCAVFTLGLGVSVWVGTLTTRNHLSNIWAREPPLIQSLLQQKVSGYQFLYHWVCKCPRVAAGWRHGKRQILRDALLQTQS